MLEAAALHLSGEVDDHRPLLEVAEFETRGLAAAHAVTLAHLGIEAFHRHDESSGSQYVRRAIEEVTASGLRQFGHIAIVFAGNSLALAHAGAVEPSRRASEHVEHLLSTLDTVHQRSHIQHHLILAEAALIRGERATALRLLRYAQNRLPREPDAVVLHRWAERIALRCSSDDGLPTVDLTPAEHRVLDSRSDELDRVSDGRGGRRGDPGGG